MTPVLAAADSSAGPWWAAPGSALLGIVVGFALKAVFDAIMEHRRVRREDRLRFIAEKMRGYADLGMLCSDTLRLMREMEEYGQRHEAAERQLQELLARQASGQEPSQEEIDDLQADVDAVRAHHGDLRSQSAAKAQEMSRLVNLLALVAPLRVRNSVYELVDTLTAEDFDEDAYDDAHARFVELAGQDLGRQP